MTEGSVHIQGRKLFREFNEILLVVFLHIDIRNKVKVMFSFFVICKFRFQTSKPNYIPLQARSYMIIQRQQPMSLRHYILGQCGQILAKVMAKILVLQIGILDFGLKWPQVLPAWSIQDNLVIPHTLWLLLNRILQQQLLPSIHSSHYFKVLKVQVF